MAFGWIAILTLWTLLIGPIVDVPQNQAGPTPQRASASTLAKR
jgi:hypothetical protein